MREIFFPLCLQILIIESKGKYVFCILITWADIYPCVIEINNIFWLNFPQQKNHPLLYRLQFHFLMQFFEFTITSHYCLIKSFSPEIAVVWQCKLFFGTVPMLQIST